MKKILCCSSFAMVLLLAAAVQAVPLDTDLVLHYKADSLNLADGANVSSWSDSKAGSPNGNLSQFLDYGVPKFKTNAYNGFPAVKFVRSTSATPLNSERTILQSAAWSWTSSSMITVFMVAQSGATLLNQRVMHLGPVTAPGGQVFDVEIRSDSDGSSVGSGVRFNNGYAAAKISPFTGPGQWHISCRRIKKTEAYTLFKYWVNNTLVACNIGTGTNTFSPVNANNVTILGNGLQSSSAQLFQTHEWYDGEVAEILVYKYLDTQEKIDTVYNYLYQKYNNLMAHNPTPAKLSVDQGEIEEDTPGVYTTNVTLNWETGHTSATNQNFNPAITQHRVYYATTEPNLAIAPAIMVAGGTATGSCDIAGLKTGTKYYWRVDEVWPRVASEPNCITGDVWTFTTVKPVPKVTVNPSNTWVFTGETATLTFQYLNPTTSETTFQWYRSPKNDYDKADDETLDGQTLQTLTISPAQPTDEGFYYCELRNEANPTGDPFIHTSMRMIGIKRQMGHWTLNLANYVGGQFVDVSDDDGLLIPATPMVAPVFVNGQYPATNQGVDFSADPNSGAWSTTPVWASAYTDHLTILAWVRWSGPVAGNIQQGIIANQAAAVLDAPTASNNFYFEVNTQTNKPWINLQNAAYELEANNPLPIGQWVHVAVTVGPAGTKIYYDAEIDNETTTGSSVYTSRNIVPIYIGCSNRNANGVRYPFNGAIDDVQIFNYQLSRTEIIDRYFAASGKSICINPDGLDMSFDVAGAGAEGDEPDCFVDILDLAKFADHWLKCSLYPQSYCL